MCSTDMRLCKQEVFMRCIPVLLADISLDACRDGMPLVAQGNNGTVVCVSKLQAFPGCALAASTSFVKSSAKIESTTVESTSAMSQQQLQTVALTACSLVHRLVKKMVDVQGQVVGSVLFASNASTRGDTALEAAKVATNGSSYNSLLTQAATTSLNSWTSSNTSAALLAGSSYEGISIPANFTYTLLNVTNVQVGIHGLHCSSMTSAGCSPNACMPCEPEDQTRRQIAVELLQPRYAFFLAPV